MNKPHKWKKEINAWADGELIEIEGADGRWYLNTDPTWHPENNYRLHDPYRELKEAKAAGKVIQFNNEHYGWIDMMPTEWKAHVSNYRVKPETVKMWQWIYKLKGEAPKTTPGFFVNNPHTPNFRNMEWVRKAEWTEIEVEVDENN